MAYSDQLIKLDWRYAILLLLFLSLLVGTHINRKTKRIVRTSKTVSVTSKQTIRVAKSWQSPNLARLGV